MRMTMAQINQDLKIIDLILSNKLENYTSKSDFELENYALYLRAYKDKLERENS